MSSSVLGAARRFGAALGLALVASVLTPFAASANPAGTGLVISEVYGGGGNSGATYTHDFIELYNPTQTPIELSEMSVQYRSASGGGTGFTNLSGTVPPNGHFLIQQAAGSGGTTALPAPDATGNLSMSGSQGSVALVTGRDTVVPTPENTIDLVGYGAASLREGSPAPGTSAATSVSRDAVRTDTDDNSADFTAGAPGPQNTSDILDPNAPVVAPVGDLTFTVGEAITAFTVTATSGTEPYAWSATGLPAGLQIGAASGEVTGTPTEAGVSEVTVTVTDAAEATADATFTITVNPAAGAITPIAEIQGEAMVSPLVGNTVTTRGVVTAVYPAGGFYGFYIQTPGTGAANIDLATHTASHGVFVRQPSGAVTVAIDDFVEVTGTVTEYAGATQVEVQPADIEVLAETPAPITTTTTADWPRSAAHKEVLEGMRYRPTGDFTVTNTYSTNQYGEVGLAAGTTPLIQRTEVELPGPAGASAVEADNLARAVVLDDGASTNFLATSTSTTTCGSRPTPCLVNGDQTPPYVSTTEPVRVGAAATFDADVIFTEGGSPSSPTYRFQPLSTVVGPDNAASPATFANTRAQAPDAAQVDELGTADLTVASFNVLNYFTTLGTDGATCVPYTDRTGDGSGVRSGCDQRGAWDAADFEKQQEKIVAAINALDADVVGLMEIENSIALGETADEALDSLVAALNADAGAGTWEANPSSTELPDVAQQDVITNAIIFKPASVDRVGEARALGDQSAAGEAFANAREPLGQEFVADAGGAPFLFVVNHFKSKGSPGPHPGDADSGDGQGASNASRVLQATALRDWVSDLQAETGTASVVLAGDFNSYSMEDPMQVLHTAGYTNVQQEFDNGEFSYSFSGQSGSLDHILVNEAALGRSTGTDIWEINAGESLALEYSRWNYHGTDFHAPGPFRSSDHDPVLLGLTAEAATGDSTEVQLLNINDFHGRIDSNTTRFATTVEQLRAQVPGTVLLSAGDNIGASLFASALAQDQPTIDVLNALELRASAVGNHEFDGGFADLRDRVVPAADWSHLGANVYAAGTQDPVLDEYELLTVSGVEVAVIGVVTQETPALVSPDGVAGLEFGDPVAAVNRVAAQLSDGDTGNGEADVIVAEFHEGAGAGIPEGSTLESEVAAGGVFADIVNETSAEVDVIFTGHTHKQYAWDAPVPGEPGVTRPILQTGSYGERIGQVVLTVDNATGDVVSYTAANVARAGAEDLSFPRVAAVKAITDAALAEAAVVGNQPVGEVAADITTAFTNGARDDRAAESTLGGVVANALRDGVAGFASPDLGVTNPGGLRAELLYAGDTSANPANTDGVVTFAEANAVLPFNNTVALVELTGADLLAVLEQQWQTNADGSVPSRPYLQLGVSDNVAIIADESRPAGSRIVSVRIDGELLDPERVYTVSTLSFLAAGGDNFRAFTAGTATDTGLLDAQLWREYLAANKPLSPDFARRQVFTHDLPDTLVAGTPAAFEVGVPTGDATAPITGTTLDLTSLGSPTNTTLTASVVTAGGDRTVLGEYPVNAGVAQVDLTVPEDTPAGAVVELVADPSGTTITLEVTESARAAASMEAAISPDKIAVVAGEATVDVTVTSNGDTTPSGAVLAVAGEQVLGAGVLDETGATMITLSGFATIGTKRIELRYLGDLATRPVSDAVTVGVVKARPRMQVYVPRKVVPRGAKVTLVVNVTATGYTPTGKVRAKINRKGAKVRVVKTLKNGRVVLKVKLKKVGKATINLTYTGDQRTTKKTRKIKVRAKRR